MLDYYEFITKTLNKSSEIAISYFGKVSGVTKTGDNNQVLTDADIAIGNYIVESVKKSFPEHNIIDEEAGVVDNKSEFTWVVDPIDGTSNFANGLPHFGIMVGLLENDLPVAGGIALPAFSELYYAEKNNGAFCNNQRIQVTKEEKLLSSLIAYGIDGHQENPDLTRKEIKTLGEIVLNIRNLRASNSAYDLAMVACGKYGAFLNKTSKIWDNVAPQVIIKEAGGVYTDYNGNPLDYTKPLMKVNENYTVCSGSPVIHQSLQEIMFKRKV